ncbi:MAG TPA: hypothetical protein VNO43_08425 [Candidatus Eisenbacteria bacterium]|nr:hypothetical protein [Candidatus Eisenbacteria bacterium]
MKPFLKLFSFVSLSLVFAAAGALAAEGPKWELLGRQRVSLERERDRIDVSRREGKFKQLQVRVEGAPVEINNMRVTFGNDETFSPNLRHRFDENSKTRVIDLPGERRTIKSIDFNYQSTSRREGNATVEVYGR